MSIARLKPAYVKSALERLKKTKSGKYLDFSKNDRLLVEFLLACSQGDVRIVKTFLDAGANPNEFRSKPTAPNGTPLFNACLMHQLDVAEVLRKAGADINKENENGKTPLMHAKEKKNEDVVKYLLAHKATLPEIKEPSLEGDAKTEINLDEYLAKFSNVIVVDDTAPKLLKSVKELINACNDGGELGLKKFKELKEAGLADEFEKEGFDINSWLPCPSRRTALFIACESKDHSPYNLALVKELVNVGAKFDCLGENRNSSPLHAALVNEKHDVVDFFLQQRVTFQEDELKTAKILLKELSQIGPQSKYNWHVSTIDQEPCVVGWKARSNEDPDILERNKAAYHRKLRLFKDRGFFGELKHASRIDGTFFSQENGKILFLCFPCRPQAQQVAKVEEMEDIAIEPTNSLP